jgi:hypothetical protein
MRCKCSAGEFSPAAFAYAVDVDVDCAFDFHVILSEVEGSLFGLTARTQ